ncbi:hypothetical protein KBT16_01720 [Nostoc sp. CCCryo 231-06]|nr:hypothetical protein [Nostoc commune]MCL6749766.1 hypothetical protein [Nostoc sp. CCCryo 231-06]
MTTKSKNSNRRQPHISAFAGQLWRCGDFSDNQNQTCLGNYVNPVTI